MTARIEGLPRLRSAVAQVSASGAAVARREIMRSALQIQASAKRRAPVDTGRLRNSIAVQVDADGLRAQVGTNVTYAPHLEFGTRRMRARPFLFPAFEEERPRFHARLKAELAGAVVRRTD